MASMLYHPIFRNVPDEITNEILSGCLSISLPDFCDPNQPFGRYDVADCSSSSVLGVCRAWLRIGTPLLYHTVVLRSKAQTAALRETLDNNPTLRRYIKRLRVEDTYGSSIADIMQMCGSGITDVWISLKLHIGMKETGSGLRRGLDFVNPKHVVFWDYRQGRSRSLTGMFLLSIISARVKTWTRLKTVRYLTEPNASLDWEASKLVTAIASCDLEYLYFTDLSVYTSNFKPHVFDEIVQMKSLVQIRFMDDNIKSSTLSENIMKTISKEHKVLVKKIAFQDSWSPRPCQAKGPPHSPATAPLPIFPLSRLDSVSKEAFISKVLVHYAGVPDPSQACTWPKLRGVNFKPLSLVCREFRTLTLPWLFSLLCLDTTPKCISLAHLFNTTTYGQHVRHIWINPILTLLPSFHDILRNTTGLISLNPFQSDHLWEGIHLTELRVVSQYCGETLQTLNLPVVSSNYWNGSLYFPSVRWSLCNLRCLRHLVWHSRQALDNESRSALGVGDALPCLESLEYISDRTDFLELLSCMELPALTELKMPRSDFMAGHRRFLWTHGGKIRDLSFGTAPTAPDLFSALCPNVKTLKLDSFLDVTQAFDPLIFNGVCNTELGSIYINYTPLTIKNKLKKQVGCLQEVDFSGFSALRTVHLQSFTWPNDQYSTDKCFLVPVAERFWSEWNIRLEDKRGIAWRARLKAPRTTKRPKRLILPSLM